MSQNIVTDVQTFRVLLMKNANPNFHLLYLIFRNQNQKRSIPRNILINSLIIIEAFDFLARYTDNIGNIAVNFATFDKLLVDIIFIFTADKGTDLILIAVNIGFELFFLTVEGSMGVCWVKEICIELLMVLLFLVCILLFLFIFLVIVLKVGFLLLSFVIAGFFLFLLM